MKNNNLSVRMQGILSLEEWTVADSKEQRDKWFIIYGLRLYCAWSMTPRWPSTREAWESAVDAFNSKNTLSAAAEDGVRQNTTLAAFFHSGSFSCLHNHSRRLDGNSLMFSTATSSDGSSFFRCWMASSLSRDGLYRKFEQLGLGWIVLSTTGWSKLRWESGSACRRPVNEKSRWCPSVRGIWSLSRSVVHYSLQLCHALQLLSCVTAVPTSLTSVVSAYEQIADRTCSLKEHEIERAAGRKQQSYRSRIVSTSLWRVLPSKMTAQWSAAATSSLSKFVSCSRMKGTCCGRCEVSVKQGFLSSSRVLTWSAFAT